MVSPSVECQLNAHGPEECQFSLESCIDEAHACRLLPSKAVVTLVITDCRQKDHQVLMLFFPGFLSVHFGRSLANELEILEDRLGQPRRLVAQ